MARLRCFVAAGLPEPVRGELSAFVMRLAPGCPGVKWADPAGMHLTLKFFGSVDEKRLLELTAAVARAATVVVPFRPHVTLGRSKGGTDKRRTGETLQSAHFESSSWGVESIQLYQSRPGPAGPTYECLWKAPFMV